MPTMMPLQAPKEVQVWPSPSQESPLIHLVGLNLVIRVAQPFKRKVSSRDLDLFNTLQIFCLKSEGLTHVIFLIEFEFLFDCNEQ